MNLGLSLDRIAIQVVRWISLVVLEPRPVAWSETENTPEGKDPCERRDDRMLILYRCVRGKRSSAWNYTWQGTH